MKWAAGLFLALLAFIALQRIRIPREPEREGKEDREAVEGYDRISRGSIMRTERFLALRLLRDPGTATTIIDVGCGPGYLVRNMHRAFPLSAVIGIDVNRDMLRRAKANIRAENIGFCLGDGTALPFRDDSLDIVVCTGAFHHLPDASEALREFHRVLKPGARFLILELRRDIRRLYYWMVVLIQQTMPRGTRRVNGPTGSVWSSYTLTEMQDLLSNSPFRSWHIRPYPAWMIITGNRSAAGGVD